MPSSAKKVKLRQLPKLVRHCPDTVDSPLYDDRFVVVRRNRHRDGGGAWLKATINEGLAWLLKSL